MNTNSTVKYEDYYNSLKTNAEDSYTQALKNAELNRQRAVLEAGNQYNSSRTISGANAQALSSMGLTGSGYSRYLDSQAYAQKQGAINSAYEREQDAVNQAQAIKDSAYVAAEGLYAEYLLQQETNRKNAYQGIYDKLPTLSFSDIDRLGATMGLNQADIDALKAARNDMTYASLLGTNYGQKTLDDLVATGQLMDDRGTNPKGSKYKSLLGDMMKLSDTEISNKFRNKDGTGYLSYSEAETALNSLKGTVDDATYAALKKQFDEDYKVTAYQGFKVVNAKKTGKDGKNIKIKYNDETYKVQYSGDKSADAALAVSAYNSNKTKAVEKISSGEVFKYQGKLYLYQNGNAYELEARDWSSKGYNNLYDEV